MEYLATLANKYDPNVAIIPYMEHMEYVDQIYDNQI